MDNDDDNSTINILIKSDFNNLNNTDNEVYEKNEFINNDSLQKKMWTLNYIGLYAQYAAVGIVTGSLGITYNFCVYYYDGSSNLCSNAKSLIFLAWSFKIFYALFTDCIHPFGSRRKSYIIIGWSITLILLLILACTADKMTAENWIICLIFTQASILIADVPADGFCIELEKTENSLEQGQIFATAQRIRFTFAILIGLIQTFLVNGESTNDPDCEIKWDECWKWGLTVNQYYGIIFVLVLILFIPMCYLKEPIIEKKHRFKEFLEKIWNTLQNLTTGYLVVYIIGIGTFTSFSSRAAIYMQYYIIELSNLQTGIDTICKNVALVLGIWIFQKFLIKKSWRITSYGSTILISLFSLLWIPAFYNVSGLRNGWYTIFIDIDQTFAIGLGQVLLSMATIELSYSGLEATTYEFLMSLANSVATIKGILSTQLLFTVNANGCDGSDGSDDSVDSVNTCPSNTVDISSEEAFENTNGPEKFTNYTLLIIGISFGFCFMFTNFLPKSKEQCIEWKYKGDVIGKSKLRAKIILIISTLLLIYGITGAILLLNKNTSCLQFVGGNGC